MRLLIIVSHKNLVEVIYCNGKVGTGGSSLSPRVPSVLLLVVAATWDFGEQRLIFRDSQGIIIGSDFSLEPLNYDMLFFLREWSMLSE